MAAVIPGFSFPVYQGDTWHEVITIYQNKQAIVLTDIISTWRLKLTARDASGNAGVTSETGNLASGGLVEVDWVAEDLHTGTARIMARPHIDSPLVLFDLHSDGTDPEITLDASGNVTINVPAADTADWNFDTAVCECKINMSGVTQTRFTGLVVLTQAVNY